MYAAWNYAKIFSDFEPVSIKMAKEQGLSLNPAKISEHAAGLCCLKYEQETYEHLLKYTPKVNAIVQTPDGRGLSLKTTFDRQGKGEFGR